MFEGQLSEVEKQHGII